MYKLIDWTEDLHVGIRDLDDQHHILVELLNELHYAIHRRLGLEVCRDVLERLRRFADVHFTFEENYLRSGDRVQADRHREERRELMQQLDALLARIDTLQSTVSFHRLHKLKVWLLQHILAADEGISQYRRSDTVHFEARQARLEKLKPTLW